MIRPDFAQNKTHQVCPLLYHVWMYTDQPISGQLLPTHHSKPVRNSLPEVIEQFIIYHFLHICCSRLSTFLSLCNFSSEFVVFINNRLLVRRTQFYWCTTTAGSLIIKHAYKCLVTKGRVHSKKKKILWIFTTGGGGQDKILSFSQLFIFFPYMLWIIQICKEFFFTMGGVPHMTTAT